MSVKKKVCYFSSPLGPAPPHIKAASFSLNVNIKSVDHKSQHSLHKLPLPQPLILPSDEGEEREGSYCERKRLREGETERERVREMEVERGRSNKNNYLLQRFDICWTLPPSKNVQRRHPIKFGGGLDLFGTVFGAVTQSSCWEQKKTKKQISYCNWYLFAPFFSCFHWWLLIYKLICMYNRFQGEWESRMTVTELWRPIGELGSAITPFFFCCRTPAVSPPFGNEFLQKCFLC